MDRARSGVATCGHTVEYMPQCVHVTGPPDCSGTIVDLSPLKDTYEVLLAQ